MRVVVAYVTLIFMARVLTLVGRRPQSVGDTLRSLFDPTFYLIEWASLLAFAAPLGEYLIFRWPQRLEFNVAGGVIMLASGVLIAEANRALGGAYTPYVDRQATTTALVTRGIYKYIRHPVYLAGFLLTGGAALMLNARFAWAFTLLAWGALALRVRREERLLRANTPGYDEYMRRVKRFIPGVF